MPTTPLGWSTILCCGPGSLDNWFTNHPRAPHDITSPPTLLTPHFGEQRLPSRVRRVPRPVGGRRADARAERALGDAVEEGRQDYEEALREMRCWAEEHENVIPLFMRQNLGSHAPDLLHRCLPRARRSPPLGEGMSFRTQNPDISGQIRTSSVTSRHHRRSTDSEAVEMAPTRHG